jgi:autotransporter-associated beta strand protein
MKHSSTHYARRCAPMILLLASSLTASADVIYSNLQDLEIPTTFDGIYLDVETGVNDTTGTIDWGLNLIFGGVAVFNDTDFQPVRETDAGNGTLSNLSSGAIVNASSTFDSSGGTGASTDHMDNTFTAATEGYIGFQLTSGNYGWMRVVLDGSGSAFVKDWAYDNSGGTGAIATGNVLQSGSTVTVDSSSGSFTLGSALTGTQSLVKDGSGTTTLNATNTYSGTTTVSSGMLLVNSDNSGATGDVTVESGATLGGSGIIGGATTIQLGGFLAAGNSPGILSFDGDLTLDAGSSTVMEISGTTRGFEYDGIDVGGQLTYGGALTLTSDTLIASGVYELFGLVTETGNFSSIILSGTAYTNNAFSQFGDVWTVTVGDETYTFSQLTGDLTVVPEPGTYALLGGLLALGSVMLRRRR